MYAGITLTTQKRRDKINTNSHGFSESTGDETHEKNMQICILIRRRSRFHPRNFSKTPSFPSTNPCLSFMNLHQILPRISSSRHYSRGKMYEYCKLVDSSIKGIELTSQSKDWQQCCQLLCHGSKSSRCLWFSAEHRYHRQPKPRPANCIIYT